MLTGVYGKRQYFNPPAPWGAGRLQVQPAGAHTAISIHPPRGGRDRVKLFALVLSRLFQSTRPVGGGTWPGSPSTGSFIDFNPPAPCGAGQAQQFRIIKPRQFQSTRPVGGRDARHGDQWSPLPNFNSPAPRGGRDAAAAFRLPQNIDFNPTCPAESCLQTR